MLNREVIQRMRPHTEGLKMSLSNRHIYAILLTLRARLLTQEQKKGQKISAFAYQVLPCVELELAPMNECPCTPQSGCTILKSKHPLPDTLVGSSKHLFRVTGLDGTLVFAETTFQEKKYKNGNRFTRSNPDFFIRDRHLFITVTKKIETVTVEGLFSNPIEASIFPSGCNPSTSCLSYLDYEFPFEEDLIDGMIDLATPELVQTLRALEETQGTVPQPQGKQQ